MIKKKSNLILIGMMGAGKTTVGKRLAPLLSMDFCDIDELYEEKYEAIVDTFRGQGEELFRQREGELLGELSEKSRLVIACGGGTVLSPNFELIRETGIVVYLRASVSTLIERMKREMGKRPLLSNGNAVEGILERRTHLYESLSDFAIDTDSLSAEMVALVIKKKIKKTLKKNNG